jgi:hypothetical protein
MSTEEDAARMSLTMPASGVHLYFRRGDKNSSTPIVQEATTAHDGSFATTLPSGAYCMLLSDATVPVPPKEDKHTTVDEACVEREWERCEVTFVVGPEGYREIAYLIQEHCSFAQPCTQYDGPLPP